MNNAIRSTSHHMKYIFCVVCNKQIPRKYRKKCNRCKNEIISQRTNRRNMNEGDDEIFCLRQQIGAIENFRLEGINKRNCVLKN